MSDTDRTAGDPPVRSATEVAADIPADAVLAVSGFGSVGYPKAVPRALTRTDRDLALTVISGGAVGDEIDTELAEADAVARRYPFATREAVRERANDGRTAFRDPHVSDIADAVRFGGLPDPDVAVVEAVSVGDGWLVPSTSVGQTPALVETADRLVVEVNDAQPRALEAFHDVYTPDPPPDREPVPLERVDGRVGSPRITFDSTTLEAVVRTDRPDAPYEFRDPTDADRALGEHIVTFLADEAERNPALSETVALEFGVGSIGNALMGALEAGTFGDRRVAYFGEVVQDGLLDALDDGLLDGASATSLALSADGQRRLFDDIERYAGDVVLRPAEVSNDAGLVDRFGVVAVNAAVEVDLYGHVNSTHIGGSRLVGGIGGSGDFARHALVSVVACPATAAGGDVSRVVPMATHVDHTEHDVDVVVTDRGVADLRGLSPRESAEALVAVAHPDFRPDLRRYLERASEAGGHVPHDLDVAFDWQ